MGWRWGVPMVGRAGRAQRWRRPSDLKAVLLRYVYTGSSDVDEGPGKVELWTWGKGEVGQLGLGDEETRRSPALVRSLAFPHSAGLASGHGRLGGGAVVASEAEDPELRSSRGSEQRSEAQSRLMHSPCGGLEHTVGIACGLFHSGLWSAGKLWLWGKGGGGRLGLGSEDPYYTPTLLPSLTDVKSLALGGLHSAAITNGGSLYTWGFGSFGALGHGSYSKELVPRKLVGEEWMDNVTYVAAGGSHTAAISSSGDLYTWGRDEGEGRLGHGAAVVTDEGAVSNPVKVQALLTPVAAVACGGFSTMALTSGGQLWSWGGNSNYELGRGNRRDDWRPKPIPELESSRIIQVACGGYHAAALTEDGNVLTWGHGGHGQLGHGSLDNGKVPCVVESLMDERVVSIACGGSWTACVTATGKMYTWGKNRDSQLGVPSLMDTQMTPVSVTFGGEDQGHVIGVAAGATHGMCLVRKSELEK